MNFPGSLHNHSDFSNIRIRDSICTIPGLIDYAIELGHEVLALTDHECISGYVDAEEYYQKIKEKNPDFKLILGNEIYLCRNGLNKDNFDISIDKYFHFILLAKDLEGNKQIRELSTRAWMRSYMARGMRRVPTYYQDLIDIIKPNKGHVIGSSACIGGALPQHILQYQKNQSEKTYREIIQWCKTMNNIFGKGNFFLELQPSHNEEQTYVNQFLVQLSKQLDIPYIITNDAHYLKKGEAFIHEAFLNSQQGDREVKAFYETTYLMGTEELESFFEYFPKEVLEEAYQNILSIKNMCKDYSLKKPLKIPKLKWRKTKNLDNTLKYYTNIPWLKTFSSSPHDGDRHLAQAIVDKLKSDERLQEPKTYEEINTELESIWVSSEVNKAHWSDYLLNLQNIIDTCWKSGTIVGPGRGSGVGFLILYLLDITQINPLWETSKTYHWRFLNPNRVSVLDVDSDISGLNREKVLDGLRKEYGQDRVANVITFGKEKSKSAIQTAARGLGIDNDISQYIAGLIPSDRGMIRSLKQCFYGDPDNDMKPIKPFVKEMTENYPQLWEVAQRIEGLTCRIGIHAGGLVFVDEPFTESVGLMRAPDGTVITAFELHACEKVSLIKYDMLSVEAIDRIQICLDLLCKYGLVEKKATLRETYESVIGVYNLERTAPDMWKMVWNHQIQSLFQMEKQSGVQGIALTHPQTVDDLATLNSVIRLMAQEKGGEQPLHKFKRFKDDITQWYKEMNDYGLTQEEQDLLKTVLETSYGICESQERFMSLVQLPECGGFDLTWSDRLRKSIAKKSPKEYEQLTKEYFQNAKEKGLSKNLCNYVWNVLVATSRGYGFKLIGTLYSNI